MQRLKAFALLDNENWVPVITWDGCVIHNYYVSNKGRFYYEHSDGRKHLLNVSKALRVRIRHKLMYAMHLVVRAFLLTNPLFGVDQYSIVRIDDNPSNLTCDNIRVYLGSCALQRFLHV